MWRQSRNEWMIEHKKLIKKNINCADNRVKRFAFRPTIATVRGRSFETAAFILRAVLTWLCNSRAQKAKEHNFTQDGPNTLAEFMCNPLEYYIYRCFGPTLSSGRCWAIHIASYTATTKWAGVWVNGERSECVQGNARHVLRSVSLCDCNIPNNRAQNTWWIRCRIFATELKKTKRKIGDAGRQTINRLLWIRVWPNSIKRKENIIVPIERS